MLSGDEERHGDPVSVSRRDMIDAAKQSDVALEFEPGVRVKGRGYGEHLAAQLDELEDRRDGEERALVADLLGEDGGRSYL